MRITELITKAKALLAEHGDIDLFYVTDSLRPLNGINIKETTDISVSRVKYGVLTDDIKINQDSGEYRGEVYGVRRGRRRQNGAVLNGS